MWVCMSLVAFKKSKYYFKPVVKSVSLGTTQTFSNTVQFSGSMTSIPRTNVLTITTQAPSDARGGIIYVRLIVKYEGCASVSCNAYLNIGYESSASVSSNVHLSSSPDDFAWNGCNEEREINAVMATFEASPNQKLTFSIDVDMKMTEPLSNISITAIAEIVFGILVTSTTPISLATLETPPYDANLPHTTYSLGVRWCVEGFGNTMDYDIHSDLKNEVLMRTGFNIPLLRCGTGDYADSFTLYASVPSTDLWLLITKIYYAVVPDHGLTLPIEKNVRVAFAVRGIEGWVKLKITALPLIFSLPPPGLLLDPPLDWLIPKNYKFEYMSAYWESRLDSAYGGDAPLMRPLPPLHISKDESLYIVAEDSESNAYYTIDFELTVYEEEPIQLQPQPQLSWIQAITAVVALVAVLSVVSLVLSSIKRVEKR